MAIPVALIVAITVADVLSPESVHLGPLLVVAPALTASFGSSRLTALVGGLAVAALVAISVIRNSVLTLNHESQVAALLIVSAFTVLFCRLRERHLAELAQVRSVAEAAQRVLLRPLPELIGDVRIASAYRAATDQARIGGDLYAALRTPRGTRLLIGDVRGKGLPAIEEAALVLGAFRSAAHREPTLPELRTELEDTVCWNLLQPPADPTAADESFITAVLVDIPDDGSAIEVLNCGHPPPLFVHAGRVTALSPRQYATPIGMCLPQAPNGDVDTFPFAPGDTLVLYTDGVSEARDPAGRFYPLADRLTAWTDTESPEELLAHVRGDLNGFCKGTFDDDAAIVVLRREGVTGDRNPTALEADRPSPVRPG
ncbi:PP2C family protein-serine/threonine phosphatase [Streptomyces sp. NPDC057257]|uniref:PP2C family protein-serine/threonine phosphatase n=1 Tax=Streptomyces sp. NPDC057257 TaxID=3346071 RepID=UPI0036334309